jgi:hypothetical protein
VNRFSLTHLSNEVLDRQLPTTAARSREVTAELLAYIAEFDERKRFLPAAYESMLAYCIGELRLSRDEAKQRLHIARAGRACPGVFEALEQGRIHLTGLRLLAPHLTPENADDLLSAATDKSKEEIEQLLAERSPRLDVPASVTPVEGAPEHLRNTDSQGVAGAQGADGTVILGQCNGEDRARVAPLSAESYAVQFTRSREADERFRYAQDLLGRSVKPGDIAEVYDRAMKELIKKLERTRFGACAKPRKAGCRSRAGSRHVSHDVKRAVWTRDRGQCTFVSQSGRRCEARRDLQFDHVKEFARGGEATVENIRLRCPGHNQHTAEQSYGAGFMKQKREEAAKARAAARAAKERARAQKAAEREASRLQPHQLEVIPWLRELGCSEAHSRIAVERCRDMADARLEDRVKQSLRWFGARLARTVRPVAPAACP